MSEEEILLEKLADFRRDLVIAYDSSQKFALKKQIQEIENRLEKIRNQSSSSNQEKPTSNQNKMREKPPKPISENKIPEWIFLALGVFFTLLPFSLLQLFLSFLVLKMLNIKQYEFFLHLVEDF
jgi:hypothetical protein